MNVLVGALVVAAAFVAGSIPFGVLISRAFYRRDIRTQGSGNIGAANALRTLGMRGAVAVLALDALKGGVAVAVGRALGGDGLAVAAALAAVSGHCFSPFLRWRGGKGVATNLGAILALAWPAGIAFAFVWLGAAAATRYASVASLLASAAAIPVLWFSGGVWDGVYGAAATLLIVAMHRGNLARLRNGTENVLSIPNSGRT